MMNKVIKSVNYDLMCRAYIIFRYSESVGRGRTTKGLLVVKKLKMFSPIAKIRAKPVLELNVRKLIYKSKQLID